MATPSRRAEVNTFLSDAKLSLNMSIASGIQSSVTRLLEFGADPNQEDRGGNLPLQLASLAGLKVIVKQLLRHGADANQASSKHGSALEALHGVGGTPLTAACGRGHLDIAKRLYNNGKNGVDIMKADNNGATPLWWACFRSADREQGSTCAWRRTSKLRQVATAGVQATARAP